MHDPSRAIGVRGARTQFLLHQGDQVAAEAGARPVPPGSWPAVEGVLSELCVTAGVPRPNLWVLDIDTPNAFATGLTPDEAAITLNAGLLDQLTRDELRGVLAHELGHVASGDVAQSTELVRKAQGGIALAGLGALALDLFSDSLLVSLGGWLLAGSYSAKKGMDIAEFQRTRELAADSYAVHLAGNAYGLQSALVKIERSVLHASVPEWLRFASIVEPPDPNATHPPTLERLTAIEPSDAVRPAAAVCARCAYSEEIGVRHCRRCGTPLPSTQCPGCGSATAIVDRFCRLCGTDTSGPHRSAGPSRAAPLTIN